MRHLPLLSCLLLAACGGAPAADDGRVVLRDLAASDVAASATQPRLTEVAVPTPSDTRTRYALLRERVTANGTVVAIFRQQQQDRMVYSRAEIDCGQRLFHVVGVGASMLAVESNVAHDGPLRPIAGLPLRQELAGFVCARVGTPLRPA